PSAPRVFALARSSLPLPSASGPPQLLVEVDAALARHREEPRDIAPGGAQRSRVLELAGRVAEAQVERLLARLLEALDEIVVVESVDLGALHSAPSRFTNLVFTGSLWPASRIAPRARSSA